MQVAIKTMEGEFYPNAFEMVVEQIMPGDTRTVKLKGSYGELLFKRDKTNGVTTWHQQGTGAAIRTISCAYRATIVGVHAMLEGSVLIQADGIANVQLQQREYLCGRLSNIIAVFTPSVNSRVQSLHVHYSARYFKELLQYCPLFGRLLQHNGSFTLNGGPAFIDEKMLRLLHDLGENSYTGAIKTRYLHVKSVELLLHITQRLLKDDAHQKPGARPHLRAEEIEALYKLAAMLEEKLSEQFTVKQLARHIGMSIDKLNRSFKQLFGQSIHQYIIKLQLKKAYLLLTSTLLSISDIAEQTGFSSKHYFSKTVKRYFGNTPTFIRRQGYV